MLVLGLGGAIITFKTSGSMTIPFSGMSLAAVVGILLNLLLPNEKKIMTLQNFSKENETVKKADLDKK